MNDESEKKMRAIASKLTPAEMRQLANDLEERANLMRQFAKCSDFAGPNFLLGHLRWSLSLGEESAE